MKLVNANVDQMPFFVIINNFGIKINAVANVKKLGNKSVCDRGFALNPSNCECECNKSCDFSEYIDYKNCNYRKRLVNELIDECNETID